MKRLCRCILRRKEFSGCRELLQIRVRPTGEPCVLRCFDALIIRNGLHNISSDDAHPCAKEVAFGGRLQKGCLQLRTSEGARRARCLDISKQTLPVGHGTRGGDNVDDQRLVWLFSRGTMDRTCNGAIDKHCRVIAAAPVPLEDLSENMVARSNRFRRDSREQRRESEACAVFSLHFCSKRKWSSGVRQSVQQS